MRLSELVNRLQETLNSNYDCWVSLSYKTLEPENFEVNQEGELFLDADGLTFDDLISLVEDDLDKDIKNEFKKIRKLHSLIKKRGYEI